MANEDNLGVDALVSLLIARMLEQQATSDLTDEEVRKQVHRILDALRIDGMGGCQLCCS